MFNNIILILTESKNLLETLRDNINFKTIENPKIAELNFYKKIDLLIIDDLKFCASNIEFYRINNIIDLCNIKLPIETIKINLPVKLANLISIINNKPRDKIFTCINNRWIYDEHRSSLFDSKLEIKFTEKENSIFKALITSPSNEIDKNSLLDKIWNYNSSSKTTTIETHLYKLKQKLPENLVQIKDNCLKLMIEEII